MSLLVYLFPFTVNVNNNISWKKNGENIGGELIHSMKNWNLVNRQNFKNLNSITGSSFGSNDSFSWICHDIMIATAQLKTLLCIRIGREVFFLFAPANMAKKKEGEARTKKSKKKRMKINRWLQWRLWQFEQQCLKYTAAATLTLPEVAQLVWLHMWNWKKLNLYNLNNNCSVKVILTKWGANKMESPNEVMAKNLQWVPLAPSNSTTEVTLNQSTNMKQKSNFSTWKAKIWIL